MNFSQEFENPEYQDAPHLSDQLLLPNLAQGYNISIVSAFVPSYLFRLLRDVAGSEEIEPGVLDLTFYMPGQLNWKSDAVARFRQYLCAYATDEVQVAQFVEDALQIIDEGKLAFSTLHANQHRPLTRSCLGVISPGETDLDSKDYVSFIDAKGGDFNSPVTPLRSWETDQYFDAQEVLAKWYQLSAGKKGLIISTEDMVEWLELISAWYANNPPFVGIAPNVALDGLNTVDKNDPFLLFLKGLPEFKSEDRLIYERVAEDESFDWDSWNGFTAEVWPEEAEMGHIPPITNSSAVILGNAKSTCVCGKVFTRIYGCPRGSW